MRSILFVGLALLAGCAAPERAEPGDAYDQGMRAGAPAFEEPTLRGAERGVFDADEAPLAMAPPQQPPDGGAGDGGGGGGAPGPQGGQGGRGADGADGQGQGGDGNGQPPANGQQPPGGPLLIYQAELHLGVFEVEATQRAVITIAKELGGFLSYQDDARVTIRVPARRFQDAIERVERVGDVSHRNIQAIDVTEEFRDLTLRLRNSEAMRERLEQLLAKAEKVEDALKVQAELNRITTEIETMKGKLRYLQDRIAFSTITVHFQPKPTEQLGEPEVYRLPFGWLDELGLPALLNLR